MRQPVVRSFFCVFKILNREETIHASSAVRKHKDNAG